MLNWLRRLLAARYRRVYAYWDGQRIRRADPQVLLRSLSGSKLFSWQTDPDLAETGDDEAYQRVMAGAREAFGLQAWTDSTPGLTEDETWATLLAFVYYVNAQKKSGRQQPISPEPTASESSDASMPNANSDSGSTGSESISSDP